MTRNEDKRAPLLLGAADWISLAATPTFAIMALLTGMFGGGPMDMLCSAWCVSVERNVPMYVLMSAFHLAPWLKLISRRQSGNRRTSQMGVYP